MSWLSQNLSTLPQKPYEFTLEYYHDIKLRNYINFGVNTVATIISTAVVFWRTPLTMKTFKWFLLNISLWSYLMDFNMTLFFIPIFMLPAPAICSLGLANQVFGVNVWPIAVPFGFLIITIGGSGAALGSALYYRYRLLNNKSTFIFSKKRFQFGLLIFHIFIGFPVLITTGLSVLTDKALDAHYWWFEYMDVQYPLTRLQMSYCLEQGLCVCGGVILDSTGTTIMLASVLVEIFLYGLIVLLGPLYIFWCLKKRTKMISKKKYNHEKKVIISLFVQTVIPFMCLILPYIYAAIEVVLQFHNPIILTSLLQISTLHSLFNALSMIILLKPYRDAIKDAVLLKYGVSRSNERSNQTHDIREARSSFAPFAPSPTIHVTMVKSITSARPAQDRWALTTTNLRTSHSAPGKFVDSKI